MRWRRPAAKDRTTGSAAPRVIGSNLAGKEAGNAASNPEKEFAEPVPLSSTPPIDFRLPPTTCR